MSSNIFSHWTGLVKPALQTFVKLCASASPAVSDVPYCPMTSMASHFFVVYDVGCQGKRHRRSFFFVNSGVIFIMGSNTFGFNIFVESSAVLFGEWLWCLFVFWL